MKATLRAIWWCWTELFQAILSALLIQKILNEEVPWAQRVLNFKKNTSSRRITEVRARLVLVWVTVPSAVRVLLSTGAGTYCSRLIIPSIVVKVSKMSSRLWQTQVDHACHQTLEGAPEFKKMPFWSFIASFEPWPRHLVPNHEICIWLKRPPQKNMAPNQHRLVDLLPSFFLAGYRD